MHGPDSPGFVFGLALGAGVIAVLLARWLRVPSILPLLGFGVALGADGLGWLEPRALGAGLSEIVELAVAVILFEGGLNLEASRLRAEARSLRLLISLGALITFVGAALVAHLALDWSWTLSILFGSLVIVTGPTVIRPIVRNVALQPRLATVLEAEGVLIDAVGAIVAAVTLQVLVGHGGDPLEAGVRGLVGRVALGATLGLAGGLVIGRVLRTRRLIPEGLENIVTLGAALLLFQVAEALQSESGILCVVVAGVVVGNVEARVSRTLREFEEQLTVALIAVVFILLAADVRLAEVGALGRGGALTVAALIALVRPIGVLACTVHSELSGRERVFLALIAPRGIVAAAVASLFAAFMKEAGVPGGTELRALVFLTIVGTVVFSGITAPLLATLLRVRAPERDGVAILGAEELALTLGGLLRDAGASVVFVDSNPQHCREAEERGFRVVHGNALEERALEHVGLQRARAVVGLTANGEVNSLFAREAIHEFGVPEAYVVLTPSRRIPDAMLERHGTLAAFDGPKDVEGWSVRLRHGRARVGLFAFETQPEPASLDDAEDRLVFLLRRRGAAWQIEHRGLAARAGDETFVAIALDAEPLALEALARTGWKERASG
ncbi:MAG: cation:proton antiporter [Myxococcota bacterium]